MQMGNSIRARRRQHDETSGGLTRKATRQSECKSGRKTVTRKDRLEISRRKRRGRIGQEQAAESTGEELEKMGYEGKSGMKPCNKNMSTRRRRGRTDSFVHISLRVVTQETHMNNAITIECMTLVVHVMTRSNTHMTNTITDKMMNIRVHYS